MTVMDGELTSQESESGSAATVQLPIWTIAYDVEGEAPLAEVLKVVSERFPHLKLNTVGRGLHSTLLYLDDLTFEEAREFGRFWERLDRETLARYSLLESFRIVDSENIELVVVGTRSRFIALKPHPEMIRWQMNFWRLVEDLAPKFFERHKAHRNPVSYTHLTLPTKRIV